MGHTVGSASLAPVAPGDEPGECASPHAADRAFQEHILEGVSRTFALTIPQLPPRLREVVSNAYLLCRIADTIEDEPALEAADKRRYADEFTAVVRGERPAEPFATRLVPRLGAATPPAERELLEHTPAVIRLTRRYSEREQAALARCVRIMAAGMAEFQQRASPGGLRDLAELDRYCYHVAGVVGEMLTALFCAHSSAIAAREARLMELAVSFGQGLQMTNILKDVWEDRARGACWLPRDVFLARGVELARLGSEHRGEGFAAALHELVGVARAHLARALEYTLLIPPRETGIRRFCLWALGMAVLTLRKIDARPHFRSGDEVKISRRAVKATVLATSAAAGHDPLLRALFGLAATGLPRGPDKRIRVA